MQTNKMTYVHCAIVFVFAFFFRFVPPIGQITPYGMGILGTFIAAIYGWSTIGMAFLYLLNSNRYFCRPEYDDCIWL